MLFQLRPNRNDLIACVNRDGDFPIALTQGRLQLLHHQNIARQIGQLPLEFESIFQPTQVTRWVMHVGLLDFYKVQSNERVKMHIMGFRRFANHLFVDLAAAGNINHQVAQHLRGARQTPTWLHRLGAAVFLLYR